MPGISSRHGRSGALIDVHVGVSAPQARAMQRASLELPPPIRLVFIVDTGADTTLVDDQHLRALEIASTGRRKVMTVANDAGSHSTFDTYPISLEIRRREQDGAPAFSFLPSKPLAGIFIPAVSMESWAATSSST